MLQLKPMEESFYKISKHLTREIISNILICEGKRDSEIIKGVIHKISKETKRNLAITDCGGERVIPEITKYIITLGLVSKRLKTFSIIIDADEYTPKDRAMSIANSLRSRTRWNIKMFQVDADIFKLEIQDLKTQVFVKVAGNNLWYAKHTIDDYIVCLLMFEGEISEEKAKEYKSAKECVNEFIEAKNITVRDIIENAREENVQRAFKNIINYLSIIGVWER